MTKKTVVSCYGFWPGIPDGVAGVGPPRTVYCIIGEKARMLKLSNGEVSDLLDPETVRKMYGPCSLNQMISYIKEARLASGGGLGVDFETSIFFCIVEHPEQYTSDDDGTARLSRSASDKIPKRWKEYFVILPKKGSGGGRRENEVRGYLLAVRVNNDAGSQLTTEKARRYRNQAQRSQKLLRQLIPEYRYGVFGSEKQERLQSNILSELQRLEDALHVLGIPVSEEEKVTSQKGAEDYESTGIVTPKSGRRPVRHEQNGSARRRVGTAIIGRKHDDPPLGTRARFVPGGLSEVVIPFPHVAPQPVDGAQSGDESDRGCGTGSGKSGGHICRL